MGLGAQRARKAVSSDLPDNKLYKNFVREGALLTEEEWVGGPKFEGKRQTFEEDRAGEVSAAAEPAGDEEAGGFSLKRMKAFICTYLEGSKGLRAKRKWVKSAAVEDATNGGGEAEEEEAMGALFERAAKKLVKRGRVEEAVVDGAALLVLLVAEEAAPLAEVREEEEVEAAAAEGGKKHKRRK
jgi:hypothetical protein